MKQIKEVNELFLLTVVTGFVGSYLFSYFGFNRGDYFVSLLYSQFILVLPTLIYVIYKKVSVKELFRYRKIKIGTVFLSILFAFLIMPLMQEINLISMLFAKNEITSKMYAITDGKPFILSMLVIAVVPAFLEESVYRGCFFNVYSKQSPLKAVVLSAFFFGLMHLNFNQFSYAFVMGMIFCLLVEGTNSIFTSMIVHFTINCSSVVMLYVIPFLEDLVSRTGIAEAEAAMGDVNSMSRQSLLLSILIYGVIACFTTALAVLVYIAIVKHENRWNYVKQLFRRKHNQKADANIEQKKESFLSLPMLMAIAICITYMIYYEIYY